MPQQASVPHCWYVNEPPVACPVPLCPYEAANIQCLFTHMGLHHPLHIEGYPGYNKCPRCHQYVRGVVPSGHHLASGVCKQGEDRWNARVAAAVLTEQQENLPSIFVEGERIDHVESFTYSWREIATSDDNLQACLQNLAKAKSNQ